MFSAEHWVTAHTRACLERPTPLPFLQAKSRAALAALPWVLETPRQSKRGPLSIAIAPLSSEILGEFTNPSSLRFLRFNMEKIQP